RRQRVPALTVLVWSTSAPVHTPHFPFPHLGAWPARHSRWLPPPSPEMSGRRLPVSYTGAPQSLGAPSPRVRRWRCC
ncbi:hypothetical protein LEMLEM_LOCUS21960, partial [Lemmus lemmus]